MPPKAEKRREEKRREEKRREEARIHTHTHTHTHTDKHTNLKCPWARFCGDLLDGKAGEGKLSALHLV